MSKLYALSETDVRALKRLTQRERGDPINHRPPLQGLANPGRLPPVRLGIAYGAIPAGTFSGDALTAAGKGEAKLHRVQEDGTVFDLDSLPTVAYNITTEEIPDGAEVLLLRDQTLEGDNENVAIPGYLAYRKEPSEVEERCLYLCGSQTLAVANDATNQQLQLINYANFDTTTFQINAADWTVTLLRAGKYEVRHDFTLAASSSGGDVHTSESATAYFRNAATLGTSVVGCSGVLLSATSYASEIGFENAGRTWYASSPGGDTPWKIDWVVKKNTWTNGMAVNLTSARLRYIGPITATTGNFDAPGP